MKHSAPFIILLGILIFGCSPQAHEDQGSRPNILIILADDMGYSDLGCYGGEILTPNMDRLASHGIRSIQFYSSGRCCPARAVHEGDWKLVANSTPNDLSQLYPEEVQEPDSIWNGWAARCKVYPPDGRGWFQRLRTTKTKTI